MSSNATAPPQLPPAKGPESTIPIENSRQVAMIVTSTLSIIIPTILVGLRFYVRQMMQRSIDASDLCIFAALIFTIGLHIDMYVMVFLGGFGFHGVDIVQRFGMDTLVLFLKGILAFPIIWNFTICFSKLSVLLMYTNIIAVPKMILSCRIVGFVIILWNMGGILGALLMCRPFALNWDKTIEGTCGDNRLFYMWLGAINVVAEAVILLLPVPFLFQLQLKTAKKVVVIALFSVGWMTCAVTIYRQVTLPYLHFEDMTYTGVLATIFTGIEPAVALSLACIPFLRPLVKSGILRSTTSDSRYPSRTLGSKGPVGSSGNRPFKEISDDSSEVQLRPLGSDSLKYEAEVSREDSNSEGHGDAAAKKPAGSGAILVSKGWNIVSSGKRSPV
ncbi:hypothetical protein QBC47DRAFT_364381 [Echria macrotheca]|uniref:Rhodopsin domain-containing protein n=1 Tax=Echria macrotheca TaxID=438768 RepID=A0AAJ0B456_9PEZI|nr:hypothetical protein QBC47DRAFT_364381 [Echria macrotheca]